MEIDNNKKIKASTAAEELDGAPEVKKARLSVETDPILQMSDEEINQSLSDWFDACDPALRQQSFGHENKNVVTDYINNKPPHWKSRSCTTYYESAPLSMLVSDKALCEGICNLHIFHIIAKEWDQDPSRCSYEQQLILFVVKHNLMLKKESVSMEKFVIRLLSLSYDYPRNLRYYQDENSVIKIEHTHPRPMTEVQNSQSASVVIFFYPNLQFLFKREGENNYILACEDIKCGPDSFCEALQQLNPLINSNGSDFHWSIKEATQKVFDQVLMKYNQYLKNPILYCLEFNKKPLCVTQEMAFCVSY